MSVKERFAIPPMGREHHTWRLSDDAPVSRSKRARANGGYESAVPISLADIKLNIPSDLCADAEESATALSKFDGYAASRLGEGSLALGPMSVILLRTEATSSSQIEHLTVGAKNLALQTLDEGGSENAAIVVGNVRAMESALHSGDDMNETNLLEMHKALLTAQDGWVQYAGRYRDGLVWVGTNGYSPVGAPHVAPQPELVRECVLDLLRFMDRDDLPVIIQCAIAHAQFETIHPFADGNGRCGRALIHAVLRSKGLVTHTTPPISAGLLRGTEAYFDALTAFRSGDARPIVEQFVQACLFAASSGRSLIDDLSEQIELARERLHGVRRDAAAWKVLPHLIAQPIVNVAYLQNQLGFSKNQAVRAINTLAEHDALVARSGRRRNIVWEHRGILDVLDGYAESLRRN